jgi:hypothetical protein
MTFWPKNQLEVVEDFLNPQPEGWASVRARYLDAAKLPDAEDLKWWFRKNIAGKWCFEYVEAHGHLWDSVWETMWYFENNNDAVKFKMIARDFNNWPQ